jgi:glycine cleavage system pyridoxal-binding protein P
VSRYTSATDADRAAMLEAIGVGSTDALFADIPADLRLGRPLELPDGLSEAEVFDQIAALAATPTPTPRPASSAPACTTTTCRPWSRRSSRARSS